MQLPSACRSFCFETTSSGSIRFRPAPADSIPPWRPVSCPNTLRAFTFCNAHLASAPNPVQRALGECFGSDSLRFSGAQNIPGFRNAFNALSRASQKNEETPGISMHRVDLHGRRCRLFTNDSRIPKLDVAGSNPRLPLHIFNNLPGSVDRRLWLNAVIVVTNRLS